jgi:hypothetical protein
MSLHALSTDLDFGQRNRCRVLRETVQKNPDLTRIEEVKHAIPGLTSSHSEFSQLAFDLAGKRKIERGPMLRQHLDVGGKLPSYLDRQRVQPLDYWNRPITFTEELQQAPVPREFHVQINLSNLIRTNKGNPHSNRNPLSP